MAAPFATPPAPIAISPTNYANATVSLLEIQRRERDAQMQAENKPPPMSILQIQEQERRVEEARQEQERKVEEARQVEAEFERWWKEEQARLKGEPTSAATGGSKRGKKKPVTGGAGVSKEKNDDGDGKKTARDKHNDQSRQKSENRKQANRPLSQPGDGNQQHSKVKEPGGQVRSRKNHNTESESTVPPTTKPINARGSPASKQQSHRNGNANNDRPFKSSDNRQTIPQDRPAAGRPSVIPNVAAPAFVPHPAAPAFNPRAAVFLPPGVAEQR